MKKCSRGHYYEGDVCPYCETRLYPGVGSMRTPEEIRTMTCYPTDNCGTKPTAYPDTETANIPLCPHCGRPVRRELPHLFNIGSIEGGAFDGKTPWNYNWNGRCENCGHDFSITMTQRINSLHNDRQTIVRVSKRQVQAMSAEGYILPDAFIGLSGVEIEQRNNVDGVKKTFISTNELKYLINALKDSPILKQLDCNEDWT